jgi:WD40-like Beta Propeller Repeat
LRAAAAMRRTVAAALAACSLLAAPIGGARAEDRIAYITPSRDNAEIHLIAPDGKDDERLWSPPATMSRELGIGALSWSADGASLAFDSAHEWPRSLAMRDIYALRLADKRLSRLMNPPDPSAFAGLPQGTVTVDINSGAIGHKFDIYVEGAAKPATLIVRGATKTRVTIENVADFGPGIAQQVRVYDYRVGASVGQPCWFNVAVAADVQPSKTVYAGELKSLDASSCPVLSSPVWRADGGGLFTLYKEASHAATRSTNNIWQVPAEAEPGKDGRRLLEDTAWLTDPPSIFAIAASPRAKDADQLLMLLSNSGDRIWRGDMRDPRAAQPVGIGLDQCPSCRILGAAWLPDGSGFLFSRYESATGQRKAGAVIYAFDLASKKPSEVLRLPGELIGRLTVSPDGRRIVFERGPRFDDTYPTGYAPLFGPHLLCPCGLWIADRDGGNLKLLVQDGRAPAWRPQPK